MAVRFRPKAQFAGVSLELEERLKTRNILMLAALGAAMTFTAPAMAASPATEAKKREADEAFLGCINRHAYDEGMTWTDGGKSMMKLVTRVCVEYTVPAIEACVKQKTEDEEEDIVSRCQVGTGLAVQSVLKAIGH